VYVLGHFACSACLFLCWFASERTITWGYWSLFRVK